MFYFMLPEPEPAVPQGKHVIISFNNIKLIFYSDTINFFFQVIVRISVTTARL
jgi:hypothetical protein